MANEKTPLLSKPVEKSDNEVIVKMPAEYEYDMNKCVKARLRRFNYV